MKADERRTSILLVEVQYVEIPEIGLRIDLEIIASAI
jgi:hypothetical protein